MDVAHYEELEKGWQAWKKNKLAGAKSEEYPKAEELLKLRQEIGQPCYRKEE